MLPDREYNVSEADQWSEQAKDYFYILVTTQFFCGCGSPESALEALHKILRCLPLYERDNQEAFEKLVPDDGVQYFILYVLDEMKLTEHGGSVGGCWLDDRGKDLLGALDRNENNFEDIMDYSIFYGTNNEPIGFSKF